MYAGIDIGYNATKFVAGDRRAAFPSAVGTPDRSRFTLTGDNHAIILTAPRHVLIGEEAVRQSRLLSRREDRRWIESDEYHDLFLAAITELCQCSTVDLHLVTGLPVAFYSDREALQDLLLGPHDLQREHRKPQHVNVHSARVIPQPFGALLSEILDETGRIADHTLAGARVGVIDVGGKTCNILTVNRLTEISRETASVNVGGWTLVRTVGDWLAHHYPGLDELRDHDLAAAIQARTLNHYGEPVAEFPDLIADLTRDLAGQILAEATHLWNGGATLDAIRITGGGALLLGDHIRHHWPHARIVADPVYANASGYYKLARRLFSQ